MKNLFILLSTLLLVLVGCQDTRLEKLEEKVKTEAPVSSYEKSESSAAGFDAESRGDLENIEEKIIRTAYVTIRSGKVNEAYDTALSLVKKYDGMIVNSRSSKYEEREEAVLEIKIKPEHFLSFLDDLKPIGDIESKTITEEDVTEEYYDIEARLTNARKVRDRLFDLLNRAHKVEEVLKVEKEIERIGEKIERLEGKLRYLNSKTDYARVKVTIYNKRVRVVEQIGIKKGFLKSFQYSIKFFFGIIWFVIIIIPLIIIIIILWMIIAWLIRRKRRKRV
jgi:hypothetical protein